MNQTGVNAQNPSHNCQSIRLIPVPPPIVYPTLNVHATALGLITAPTWKVVVFRRSPGTGGFVDFLRHQARADRIFRGCLRNLLPIAIHAGDNSAVLAQCLWEKTGEECRISEQQKLRVGLPVVCNTTTSRTGSASTLAPPSPNPGASHLRSHRPQTHWRGR